jgi:hypothetical protein
MTGKTFNFEDYKLNRIADGALRRLGAHSIALHRSHDCTAWIAVAQPTAQRALQIVRSSVPPAPDRSEDDLRAMALLVRDRNFLFGSGLSAEEAIENLREPITMSIPTEVPEFDSAEIGSVDDVFEFDAALHSGDYER